MPILRQISCHIHLTDPLNTKLEERRTKYGDGFVETFVAVPDEPSEFCIALTSSGFIAPGISMFVFMDGQYQCNRNRRGLVIPGKGVPSFQTEVKFVVRQKEHKRADGKFVGRPWRFEKLNVVPADEASFMDPDIAGNIGTIEVVVLRCKDSQSRQSFGIGPLPSSHARSGDNFTRNIASRGSGSITSARRGLSQNGEKRGIGLDLIGPFDGTADGKTEEIGLDGNWDGPRRGYYYGTGGYDEPRMQTERVSSGERRRSERNDQYYTRAQEPDFNPRQRDFQDPENHRRKPSIQNDDGSFCSIYRISDIDGPASKPPADLPDLQDRADAQMRGLEESYKMHGLEMDSRLFSKNGRSPQPYGNPFATYPGFGQPQYHEAHSYYPSYTQPTNPLQPAGASFCRPATGRGEFDRGELDALADGPFIGFRPDIKSTRLPQAFETGPSVSKRAFCSHGSAIDAGSDETSVGHHHRIHRSLQGDRHADAKVTGPRARFSSPHRADDDYCRYPSHNSHGSTLRWETSPSSAHGQPLEPTKRLRAVEGLDFWNGRKQRTQSSKGPDRGRETSSRRSSTETIRASSAWNETKPNKQEEAQARSARKHKHNEGWAAPKDAVARDNRSASSQRNERQPNDESRDWKVKDADKDHKTPGWDSNTPSREGNGAFQGSGGVTATAGQEISGDWNDQQQQTWDENLTREASGFQDQSNDATYGASDFPTIALSNSATEPGDRKEQKPKRRHRLLKKSGRGRPSSPPIKPYFHTWNQGPTSTPLPAPSTLYTFPEEPLYSVPESAAASSYIEHQVRAGPGAEYTHRTARPEYIDSFEAPYAVFRFKYRSRPMLAKILGRDGAREGAGETRARLMGMRKEDIVEEMLREKVPPTLPPSRSASSGFEADDEFLELKSKSGSGSGSLSERNGAAGKGSGKSRSTGSDDRASKKVDQWDSGTAPVPSGWNDTGAGGLLCGSGAGEWDKGAEAKADGAEW